MENTKQLISFLRRLRAVRRFEAESVPPEALQDILEVARWSGSSRNIQPWEFIVITDKDVLQRLSECDGFAQHLAGAGVGIALVMSGSSREQEAFDEGRLSERIMLAAAAHGLGASIGWFKGEGRKDAADILGVPEGKPVRTSISIGYPDQQAMSAKPRNEQPRKPLSEIAYKDSYGKPIL